MKPTRTLTEHLRPLIALAPTSLAHVAGGGQSASTSTSGTPAAGDDTVGDATLRTSPTDFSVVKTLD